ncbi:hypothetical protein EG329_001396 [Mollisiaceae sp. DMI_Dod_QoI]|nr:hypothetical protein EG329_001396 [Helotiales sp. DMI_Dod_QoI]
MPHPHALTGLTVREAITDGLYRAVMAFDLNDVAMLDSAFAGEDVTLEMHAGGNEHHSVSSLSMFKAQIFDHVGPLDTMHMISNVRIDVKDGADSASLTAYSLNQHCPTGKGYDLDAPKYLVGGEYTMDFVRDEVDGLWKIKKWVMNVIWRQGDPSVMQRPASLE